MPVSINDQLMALAQGVRIERLLSPAGATYPGRSVAVQLSLPAGAVGPDGLTVTQTEMDDVVEDFAVSSSQLTKNVRFDISEVADIPGVNWNTPLRGGLPIASAWGQIERMTLGNTLTPGLPGSLGSMTGLMPVARAVKTALPLTVALEVRWSFRDEAGGVTFDVDWRLGPADEGDEPPVAQGRGGELNPAPADALKPLHLALPIAFVGRAGEAAESAARRFVHASVRLVAGGVSTPWVEVPRLEVRQPLVVVPSLLMIFAEANYEGACALLTPGDSLVCDGAEALQALEELRDALRQLSGTQAADGPASFPPPLGDLAPTLALVEQLIEKAPAAKTFVRAHEVKNLRQVALAPPDGGAQPAPAEDRISSLVLLGPPGRLLRCYNSRDLIDGEGQMVLACGREMFAAVADLGRESPASAPRGSMIIVSRPRGTRGERQLTTFDRAISSMRFEG